MRAAARTNPSLWWQLSWQLSCVIVAVVASVIVGLCVWAAMAVMSPNLAMEEKMGAAVAAAVARDGTGRLLLHDTPELQSLKQRNTALWYVAATLDGDSVAYGTIPTAYAGLADLVHLFNDADIRGGTGVKDVASVDNVDTVLGEVRILSGGFADRGWPVLTLLAKTHPIYIPLISLALPAIFLTVPQIVRRALARMSDVAQKASEIEPRQRGVRLPVAGIPKEVAPLVVAFNGALGRLENEFGKRRRFLIDAAHELRTPIAIMQTRIDGMAEGEERSRLLRDAARLAGTAEQLLDFERNDQAADIHETVDLVEIARMAVADLAPIAISAGYEIAFHGDVERLLRQGSPSALQRAVGNLIRNAVEHGDRKGTIAVTVSAGGEIAVADEGPGIAAEYQELVFEPFYRVVPSSQGAGLGLSLVKQIAANHGGQVSLVSNAAGTRVAIRL